MKKYTGYIAIFFMAIVVFFAYRLQLPLTISGSDTPVTEFSTQRALTHLKEISRAPHYTGTEEHERVREYLIQELKKLGLTVETQEKVIFNRKWNSGVKAKNIIAVIEGNNHGKGKSLLLLSHYDSKAAVSYGASDDGSGVVTILESIRAFLSKGEKPDNDIIILFSDAEELGLLGALAFVKDHPLAKNTGIVINFEARGTGGPSFMLIETNGGNEQMIREFARSRPPFPVANSLLYSLYKLLPNDTDLTVFREDGDINGFNFAFIDRFYNYHMAMDNIGNLDLRSLEHQGTYLTALLDHFSKTDLSAIRSDKDYVYFNFPLAGMIFYPFSLIYPLLALALFIFIVLIVYGIRRGMITGRSLLTALGIYLLLLVLIHAFTRLAWKLILILYPGYNDILHGFTYNGYYYLAAFSAISLAITFFTFHLFLKKHSRIDLLAVSLFSWLIISSLTAFYLKGGSFFIIPVYFGSAILSLMIFRKTNTVPVSVILILSIPVLVIFSPFVQVLTVGLGMKMMGLSMLFVVLIWGLIAVAMPGQKQTKILSYVFFIAGIVLLITASAKSGWTKERKKPDSLIYLADLNHNKAYMASYDRTTDGWTSKYLGKNPEHFNEDQSFVNGFFFNNLNLFKETGLKNILPAEVKTLTDTIAGEERSVKVVIKPERRLNVLQLLFKDSIAFRHFAINGYTLEPDRGRQTVSFEKGSSIKYLLDPEETLSLDMRLEKNTGAEFLLYEISFDLLSNPEFNIDPRPEIYTQAPRINDAVVTVRSVKF